MRRGTQRTIGATALVALTAVFLGCMSLSIGDGERLVVEKRPAKPDEDEGVLQQRGSVPSLRPGVEQKVYYPVPYASPPNLQIGYDEHFVVVDQQADHFVIRLADNAHLEELEELAVPTWVA